MSLTNKIKELFNKVEVQKFVDVKSEDGARILHQETEELTVGEKIQEIAEDMTMLEIEDGDIKIEDGRTLVIKDGMLESITEAETEDTETETPVDTTETEFKTVIKFAVISQIYKWDMNVDGDTFEIGTKITATWEDGTEYSVGAGTYKLEDGRMITLDSESVVVLITDATGTVEAAPAVGDNVDGQTVPAADTEEPAASSVEDEEAFAIIVKQTQDFEELKTKFAKLEEEFNKLAKAPSREDVKFKMDFTAESNGIKSPLHSMLR